MVEKFDPTNQNKQKIQVCEPVLQISREQGWNICKRNSTNQTVGQTNIYKYRVSMIF